MKRMVKYVLVGIGLLAAAEVSIHLTRITDFPLYDTNSSIGYIPKPNQSGRFAWKNDWVTNELSMGTDRPFRPTENTDLLLIGDSLVNGGNPLAQRQRIGPMLEKRTGWTVWPVSAGSWGLQNEMIYLNSHPEVTGSVDRIAFIINSEDFGPPSYFHTDFDTPRSRPFPALPYVLKRYVVGFNRPIPPNPVPVQDAKRMLAYFAANYGKPIDVVFFSKKEQMGSHCRWAPDLSNVRTHCIELSARSFRDGIHPSAAGNSELASKIQQLLQE